MKELAVSLSVCFFLPGISHPTVEPSMLNALAVTTHLFFPIFFFFTFATSTLPPSATSSLKVAKVKEIKTWTTLTLTTLHSQTLYSLHSVFIYMPLDPPHKTGSNGLNILSNIIDKEGAGQGGKEKRK